MWLLENKYTLEFHEGFLTWRAMTCYPLANALKALFLPP